MKADSIIAEFRRAASLTGIFSRVAETLQVSPNHVRQVAIGKRTSDRVMREICAEVERVQRSKRRERVA